ncbi:MAG: CsgG/HfaB family protein [Kiritimatiellia bacterium]
MRRFVHGLCLLALIFSGCATGSSTNLRRMPTSANVYVLPGKYPVRKVAIMPFKAPTELIGNSVAELFVTAMLKAGRYELVERSQIASVLGETELSLAGLTDSQAVAIGAMLGADGVIIGTVDEYATVAHRKKAIPVVGISTRMIDCGTGKVLWSVDQAKKAESHKIALPQHARAVVMEMTAGLVQNWDDQVVSDAPRTSASDSSSADMDAPVGRSEEYIPEETVPDEPPPRPVITAVSEDGLREVKVEWEVPDGFEGSCRVERGESASGTFERVAAVPCGKGHCRDSEDLLDDTEYFYRLIFISPAEESQPSEPVAGRTAPPPSQVSGLKAESGEVRCIPVSWEPSPEESVTSYEIHRGESEEEMELLEVIKGRMNTAYLDGKKNPGRLADAQRFNYKIRAVNSVGAAGEWSDVVSAATRPVPPMVTDVKAEESLPRQVNVSWAESPDEKVTGYILLRADENSDWKEIATLDGLETTAFEDRGGEKKGLGRLKDGMNYHYAVIAFNAGGARSEQSEPVTAMTKVIPSTPSGLAAVSSLPRRMELNWAPNTESDIDHYVVEASASGANKWREIARVSEPTFVEKNLEDGISRDYRIRAVDADTLQSEWCEPVTGATKPLPPAPENLQAEWREDDVLLRWDAPAVPDAAKYRIYKKGLLHSEKIAETEDLEYAVLHAKDAKDLTLSVSVVDVDDLESKKSAPVTAKAPKKEENRQ